MIYISIGSNVGNRMNNLRQAVTLLKKRYLSNVRCSIILETKCILKKHAPSSWDQPFLNMIVAGKTDLSPQQVLRGLKSIEFELGRPKEYEKWSPRVIDLDILLWGEEQINSPELTIPHPELEKRDFLLHLLALLGVDFYKKRSFSPCFTKSFVLYPQLVGVINVTTDSFSDGGKWNKPDDAIKQLLTLHEAGASFIEWGAQSTRPGAKLQSAEEEYTKLKPIFDRITSIIHDKNIQIGVDTFCPSVIRSLLETYPISLINDVKGDLDEETLKLIAERDCKVCFMHSLGIPPQKEQILPLSQRPIDAIQIWAEKKMTYLIKLGFKESNIIFDPGIGFGKSTYQNIELLRSIEELKKLNVQMMVGHSRKSYLEAFSVENASQRDLETIAVSATIRDKVDFLRVHHVADHMRFLATYDHFV